MTDLSKKAPMAHNGLTAGEAARRIAAGDITSEALVRDCLARIAARDGDVHAWAWLDADHAIRQAKQRDNEASKGPLHGVPVGIKDILDTADMPTAHGSTIYQGDWPGRPTVCPSCPVIESTRRSTWSPTRAVTPAPRSWPWLRC